MLNLSIREAKPVLSRGGILAYPTEAVYGLGCDPFNQAAVESIITLKGRDAHKGFILLIADWSQLTPLINPVTQEQLAEVHTTWPGFVTWIFPKAPSIPHWITGGRDSIAIRMSTHPVAKALSAEAPILSTSANLSGQHPAVSLDGLLQQFPTGIDALVEGSLGSFTKPSDIYDVRTGLKIR